MSRHTGGGEKHFSPETSLILYCRLLTKNQTAAAPASPFDHTPYFRVDLQMGSRVPNLIIRRRHFLGDRSSAEPQETRQAEVNLFIQKLASRKRTPPNLCPEEVQLCVLNKSRLQSLRIFDIDRLNIAIKLLLCTTQIISNVES